MTSHDIVMIGHVSNDIIIFKGKEEHILGGAVVYSSAAAVASGARVYVVTKAAEGDGAAHAYFRDRAVPAQVLPSPASTSIRNVYESEDRERRTVTLLSQAEPFRLEEVEEHAARVYHLAGLFAGEIPDALIAPLAGRGQVALDAQGVLRRSERGQLLFRDWAAKGSLLPSVTFLKTDAAEAEILTGTADRERAARLLHDLGAAEVMVTHNSEVLVYDGKRIARAPFTSRNLSGRTGRGDTCFASYLAWRFGHDVEESVAYAAALTSIKMETPGPFAATLAAVRARMKEDSGA